MPHICNSTHFNSVQLNFFFIFSFYITAQTYVMFLFDVTLGKKTQCNINIFMSDIRRILS